MFEELGDEQVAIDAALIRPSIARGLAKGREFALHFTSQ